MPRTSPVLSVALLLAILVGQGCGSSKPPIESPPPEPPAQTTTRQATDCQEVAMDAHTKCLEGCKVDGVFPDTCCGVGACCTTCADKDFNDAFTKCCEPCDYDPSCNCDGAHLPSGPPCG